jgi:acyl-CoA thioesterase
LSDRYTFPELKEMGEACPYYRLIGIEVMEVGDGCAALRLGDVGRLLQPDAVVHGGALVSLLDSAGAISVLSRLSVRQTVATVEIKVNFLQPASQGPIWGRGSVVQLGKRLAVVDVEATGPRGELLAKGLGTFRVLSRGDTATS